MPFPLSGVLPAGSNATSSFPTLIPSSNGYIYQPTAPSTGNSFLASAGTAPATVSTSASPSTPDATSLPNNDLTNSGTTSSFPTLVPSNGYTYQPTPQGTGNTFLAGTTTGPTAAGPTAASISAFPSTPDATLVPTVDLANTTTTSGFPILVPSSNGYTYQPTSQSTGNNFSAGTGTAPTVDPVGTGLVNTISTSSFPTLIPSSNGYTYQPNAQSTTNDFVAGTGTAPTVDPVGTAPSTTSSPALFGTGNATPPLVQDTTPSSAPSASPAVSSSTPVAAPQLNVGNGTSIGSSSSPNAGNSSSSPSPLDPGNGTSTASPSSQPDANNTTATTPQSSQPGAGNDTSAASPPSQPDTASGTSPSSLSQPFSTGTASSPSEPNASAPVAASTSQATGLPPLPNIPTRYTNSTLPGTTAVPASSGLLSGSTFVASASASLASRGVNGPAKNVTSFTSAVPKMEGGGWGVWVGVTLTGVMLVL